MTPPYPFNINGDSTDLVPHFVKMAKKFKRPHSVLGPGQFAKLFAKLWCEEMGCKISFEEAQAIHELKSVNHPHRSPGSSTTPNCSNSLYDDAVVRVAIESDRPLLTEWTTGFCIDCNMEEALKDLEWHVSRTIKEKSRYLLLLEGKPVCMAGRARETKNGGTINWVYTPKLERKKGFASRLVAKLSQNILDSGKSSVYLYTQLNNPTSNKIYHDIGFRVICDSWHIRFNYE